MVISKVDVLFAQKDLIEIPVHYSRFQDRIRAGIRPAYFRLGEQFFPKRVHLLPHLRSVSACCCRTS